MAVAHLSLLRHRPHWFGLALHHPANPGFCTLGRVGVAIGLAGGMGGCFLFAPFMAAYTALTRWFWVGFLEYKTPELVALSAAGRPDDIAVWRHGRRGDVG